MNGYKPSLVEATGMAGTEQCWLVEREYSDKGLITLVYATPDGSQSITQQRSSQMLNNVDITAAIEVEPERLTPVEDADTRERYADEVERMADRHDPDEAV
jgi:hypothetical protein